MLVPCHVWGALLQLDEKMTSYGWSEWEVWEEESRSMRRHPIGEGSGPHTVRSGGKSAQDVVRMTDMDGEKTPFVATFMASSMDVA
jgi:hypothetical protein